VPQARLALPVLVDQQVDWAPLDQLVLLVQLELLEFREIPEVLVHLAQLGLLEALETLDLLVPLATQDQVVQMEFRAELVRLASLAK